MGKFRHHKGMIDSDVRVAKHGNMARHGIEALQSARYDEVKQTEDKMPADVTKNIETNKTKKDPSIDPPKKMSGSYSGKFMEQPLKYGMQEKAATKYAEPKKYDEPKKLVGGQKELIYQAPKLAKAIDDATGGGGMTRYGSHKKPKK